MAFTRFAVLLHLTTALLVAQTKSPTSEQVRLWVQAASPLAGGIALLIGLAYAARGYRIDSRKHQAEWYANFRSMYHDFWNDPGMARVRKWIANPESYKTELFPVLQKRAVSRDQVSASDYDVLELVDRFGALLARFIDQNLEELSADKRWLVERAFDDYWLNTIFTERPDLQTYLESHWPRVMQKVSAQRAERLKRPAEQGL
jgi:hypothetical protein